MPNPGTAHHLKTDRLLLRMFRKGDLDAYAEICADPEVRRYLGEMRPLTRQEAWREMATFVGHWQLRGYGMWAVVERATGTLVGRAGFWFPEGWPGFELGWLIGRPYWGRGYATEAARECLRHAFWNMQRDHVISIIHPDNHRSIRVAERIGEQREGTVEILGTQALVYGILRPESAEP